MYLGNQNLSSSQALGKMSVASETNPDLSL